MYHVGRNGQQSGPFSIEQLKTMATSGELGPADLVWKEGMAGWEPASNVPGLFSPALDAGQAPPDAPAPLAQATVLPPGPGFGPTGPKPNPMALAGMILGIVSVTVGLCCCYGLPFSVAGIIVSILALNQIKTDPANQQGRGMAIAGLCCSIASIVIAGLLVIFGVAANAANWQELSKKASKTQQP